MINLTHKCSYAACEKYAKILQITLVIIGKSEDLAIVRPTE
jgi:hypothetical protein